MRKPVLLVSALAVLSAVAALPLARVIEPEVMQPIEV